MGKNAKTNWDYDGQNITFTLHEYFKFSYPSVYAFILSSHRNCCIKYENKISSHLHTALNCDCMQHLNRGLN